MTDLDAWRVEFARPAQRDLRRLDPQIRRRVATNINGLIAEPPQGDIKRLTGITPPEWRLRVGDHRVRFTRYPAQRLILIKRVLPRGRAYRD